MKKNLVIVLAFVFVLGLTCTAFAAANPFSDVPAKHWAYPAVAQLQKAGVIDGYGDGTYRGDRLATRYEMAQIVAKAMARSEKADASIKALIDKMAVEFAAELNNLGVRVAKLEKNASSIKIWGDSRIRWMKNSDYKAYSHTGNYSYDGYNYYGNHQHYDPVTGGVNDAFQQRIRIYTAADVNDKVSFFGGFGIQNRTGEYGTESYSNKAEFFQGYFTFKDIFPYGNIQLGRKNLSIGPNSFPVSNVVAGGFGYYDSMTVNFGKVLKGSVSYGDISAMSGLFDNAKSTKLFSSMPVFTAQLMYPINKKWSVWGYNVKYLNDEQTTVAVYDDRTTAWTTPRNLYGIGIKGMMGDFTLHGDYVKNNEDVASGTDKAWWAMLQWKGADRMKPGTWGLFTTYRDFGKNVIDPNMTGFDTAGEVSDKKGWTYGMNWTMSKNVVFTAHIETLKGKSDSSQKFDDMIYLRTEFWF